jgi:hypothetical protein
MSTKSDTASWLNWFFFEYQTKDGVMKHCVVTLAHVGGFGTEKNIGDAKLARYCGFDRTTVQRALRRAETAGFIKSGEKCGRAVKRRLTLYRTPTVRSAAAETEKVPAPAVETVQSATADVQRTTADAAEVRTISGPHNRSPITDRNDTGNTGNRTGAGAPGPGQPATGFGGYAVVSHPATAHPSPRDSEASASVPLLAQAATATSGSPAASTADINGRHEREATCIQMMEPAVA